MYSLVSLDGRIYATTCDGELAQLIVDAMAEMGTPVRVWYEPPPVIPLMTL
jgi:hypothetical protein